jgi:signal transduction histidine kinase
MKLFKNLTLSNILNRIAVVVILMEAPQYHAYGQAGLAAQSYQQDISTIQQLLASAHTKRFSDTTTALSEANQALILAKKNNNDLLTHKSYQRIANIHSINNQGQKAHDYFILSLDIVSNLHDTIKKDIYSELANSYTTRGDYSNAYKYHFMNYELGLSTENVKIQQRSNLKLGMFYKQLNDFEKATKYLVKSLDLSIRMNNRDEISNSYRQLAAIYVRSKNFDLALQNSLKSIYYAEQIAEPNIPLYYVYLSHAMVLRESSDYEKSVLFLEKALILTQKAGDKTAELDAFLSFGNTYSKMNQLDKAEMYYNKCKGLTSSMTENGLMAFQNSIGKLYLLQNKLDSAIQFFNASGKLCEKYGEKQLLQSNYEQLSLAYELKKNTDLSLSFLRKSVKLQDSILTEEKTKRIAEAQFKYDLVKSEEQIKIIQIRQNYAGILGIGVILILMLGFLMYFSRSKNEKNKILTDKNQEIKDTNRQLEESNEILKQFAYASAHDLKEPLRSIGSFTNIIQKKYTQNLPPEANEYMGFVTTGVRRMESLLNALLEFSSVLTDEHIENKKNEFPDVLKIVLDNLQGVIDEKKAIVRGPSVFPTIFMGEAHLKLLLSNILGNALKFSNMNAKIEVDFSITDTEFILSIKDEGIGLDKSYSDKIFKLFQRLDRVTHKESVGVGLTICKNIMDKYAGRIWFDSVIKEGTTFYLAFPISMISDAPKEKQPLLIQSRYEVEKNSVLKADLMDF